MSYYTVNRHTPSVQSQVYQVTHLRADGVHRRESDGIGPVVLKVIRLTGASCSNITMDHFLCACLFPHPLFVGSGHVVRYRSIVTGAVYYDSTRDPEEPAVHVARGRKSIVLAAAKTRGLSHGDVDDANRAEEGGDPGPDGGLPPLAVDDVHQDGNPAEGYQDGPALESEYAPLQTPSQEKRRETYDFIWTN